MQGCSQAEVLRAAGTPAAPRWSEDNELGGYAQNPLDDTELSSQRGEILGSPVAGQHMRQREIFLGLGHDCDLQVDVAILEDHGQRPFSTGSLS